MDFLDCHVLCGLAFDARTRHVLLPVTYDCGNRPAWHVPCTLKRGFVRYW
jgi:hypothetical protein